MTEIVAFEVRKNRLAETRLARKVAPELQDGQAMIKVDRFAFTANNVTYGVVGERIGYWKFFPAGGSDENAGGEDARGDWGIIPVWGFGDVVASRCADLPAGERLYGYWPMASHLVMTPAKVGDARLFDGAAHRQELPPVYNSYARVRNEPGYDPAMDDERMTLFPLYATSFCLYDFFKDNDWFGAERIIIPSASSKTAIGTAYAVRTDPDPRPMIALTSPRNKPAVEALKLYDDVLSYDEIDALDADRRSAIIDMSGNGAVLGRLHRRLGDNMTYTANVGLTHYDANAMGPDVIRERSAMFFAPGHIQKRAKDWGPGEFEKRAFAFWRDAAVKSRDWLAIRTGAGAEAISSAYQEVLKGDTPADAAWALRF